jgi:hypothetical protein
MPLFHWVVGGYRIIPCHSILTVALLNIRFATLWFTGICRIEIFSL